MIQKFEPLFIVGYPRSGTTLLLHILRSTDVYPSNNFDETHYFSHFYLRYGNLSKTNHQKRFLAAITNSFWFKKSGLVREEFLASLNKQGISYKTVLSEFMESIATKQGKERWLEKTPWHILYIDEISKNYPLAKFIFLIRDPRSVIQSVSKIGWSTGIGKGKLRIAASWRWHNMFANRQFQSISNRYICIRYEDLVLNADNVSKMLSNFLNVEIDINSIDTKKLSDLAKSNSSYGDNIVGLSEVPLSRWKTTMDQKTICAIEYIIGRSYMKNCGYEPFSLKAPSLSTRIQLKLYRFLFFCLKEFRMMFFPLVRR